MKLEKTFENEIKKIANGDGSREHRFALDKELMEISKTLEHSCYDFNKCIKKHGREKVSLCIAATIVAQYYLFETPQINWARSVFNLWTNKSDVSVSAALFNMHPAVLADISSGLRKLTTDNDRCEYKRVSIEVSTSDYQFAHGKKPKGTGHWAFFMGRDTGDISKAHWFDGKYGEAKRQAQAKARELGIGIITVGS